MLPVWCSRFLQVVSIAGGEEEQQEVGGSPRLLPRHPQLHLQAVAREREREEREERNDGGNKIATTRERLDGSDTTPGTRGICISLLDIEYGVVWIRYKYFKNINNIF